DVMAETVSGAAVHVKVAHQPFEAVGLIEPVGQFAQEGADRLAEIVTAAGPLTAPEWDERGSALSGRDDNAVGVDAFQSPGVGAQEEGVAAAALVDEFLIQLADPGAVGGTGGILPGVGDGAAVDQRQRLASGQGNEAVVDTIPTDARLEGFQKG